MFWGKISCRRHRFGCSMFLYILFFCCVAKEWVISRLISLVHTTYVFFTILLLLTSSKIWFILPYPQSDFIPIHVRHRAISYVCLADCLKKAKTLRAWNSPCFVRKGFLSVAFRKIVNGKLWFKWSDLTIKALNSLMF